MTSHGASAAVAGGRSRGESWVRRGCAVVVAGMAAYSSYAHQRQFALDGGADPVGAALWPLSVDGLVILASVGLLRQQTVASRRARWAVRSAFLLGVAVSLAANIAAAPSLGWQPIVVAGWPPLALLLAVELVVHAQHRATPVPESELTGGPVSAKAESGSLGRSGASGGETEPAVANRHGGVVSSVSGARSRREVGLAVSVPANESMSAGLVSVRTGSVRRQRAEGGRAEDVMWRHYQRAAAEGRVPTGAELDRVAGTSNYGRAVLARWRRTGRIPAA